MHDDQQLYNKKGDDKTSPFFMNYTFNKFYLILSRYSYRLLSVQVRL